MNHSIYLRLFVWNVRIILSHDINRNKINYYLLFSLADMKTNWKNDLGDDKMTMLIVESIHVSWYSYAVYILHIEFNSINDWLS